MSSAQTCIYCGLNLSACKHTALFRSGTTISNDVPFLEGHDNPVNYCDHCLKIIKMGEDFCLKCKIEKNSSPLYEIYEKSDGSKALRVIGGSKGVRVVLQDKVIEFKNESGLIFEIVSSQTNGDIYIICLSLSSEKDDLGQSLTNFEEVATFSPGTYQYVMQIP
jgi:hypothetical protein